MYLGEILMKLVELRKENIEEFKKLMQDAFQYGYESIYGKDKEQVLPDKDIEENLNNSNSYAYEMIDNEISNNEYLDKFINSKKLEGCSDLTIRNYNTHIIKLFEYLNKDIRTVDTQDLRDYLSF